MGAKHGGVGRGRGEMAEVSPLRRGVVVMPFAGQAPRVVREAPIRRAHFCATCAGPVEYGAVLRGDMVFCSVECSLGGRPA
jgi:hypothetical protein